MKGFFLTGAALIVALGAPALAETAKADDERIICKQQPGENTRFVKKVCKTAKDWRQHKRMFREAIEKKQRDSLMNTPQGG